MFRLIRESLIASGSVAPRRGRRLRLLAVIGMPDRFEGVERAVDPVDLVGQLFGRFVVERRSFEPLPPTGPFRSEGTFGVLQYLLGVRREFVNLAALDDELGEFDLRAVDGDRLGNRRADGRSLSVDLPDECLTLGVVHTVV